MWVPTEGVRVFQKSLGEELSTQSSPSSPPRIWTILAPPLLLLIWCRPTTMPKKAASLHRATCRIWYLSKWIPNNARLKSAFQLPGFNDSEFIFASQVV
jgi:hypothetical protein